jgi:hypothetical protein
MDSIKCDQIRRMMEFLLYKDNEQLLMREVTLGNKSWPSCNNKGQFYSNYFQSRKPIIAPTKVIDFAHHQLLSECKIHLMSLAIRHKIPGFEHLLKKCHRLEFISQ